MQIVSSDSTNRSSVWLTTPSLEFSTGTTPNSACPSSTWRKISAVVWAGANSAICPNCWRAAWWVKVPRGPRYATFTPRCSETDAEMISRKTLRRADVGNGPGLRDSRRSKTSSSRPGTKAVVSRLALSSPPAALQRARSFSSSSSCSSIASIC